MGSTKLKPSIRPAVAAIFCWGENIFMARRNDHLKAFGGYWAFPGGKVDSGDLGTCSGDVFIRPEEIKGELWGALVREMEEELGYNLDTGIKEKAISRVELFGHATTPDFNPHRFCTHFFYIQFEKKPEFFLDEGEHSDFRWAKATEFLSWYHTGEILVVPPVVKIWSALVPDKALETGNHDFNISYNPESEVPYIEALSGLYQLAPLSNTLPPAKRTNAFILGEEKGRRLLVDPSPKNAEELQKLLNVLKKFPLDHIFLTHHHPDHHEHAIIIAEHFRLGLMMSAQTKIFIEEKFGQDYFRKNPIQLIKDGDTITTWKGKQIIAHALPGHDRGLLGIAPQTMEWFIVGDLIQGVGTVVVAAPEGDMKSYFSSLQKVIQLAPKIILPSHGIATGGTFRLEETLKHRKKREAQIKGLLKKNMSEEKMLNAIYPDLRTDLLPLALENIRSHLKKIGDENL